MFPMHCIIFSRHRENGRWNQFGNKLKQARDKDWSNESSKDPVRAPGRSREKEKIRIDALGGTAKHLTLSRERIGFTAVVASHVEAVQIICWPIETCKTSQISRCCTTVRSTEDHVVVSRPPPTQQTTDTHCNYSAVVSIDSARTESPTRKLCPLLNYAWLPFACA